MRVATIGAGLMASAIAAEVTETVILGHDRVDVTSNDSIVEALRDTQPDVVVYCAAKHSLAWCETHATEAFDVNAKGVERVARLVPTVYLSTDYVFSDGGPHSEVLPGRQPRSVYGRSKLAGELATLENDGIVVRISGVFDERFQSHKGKSFPEMVATSYDPLTLPSDQIFSPTYARDAAERIAGLVRGMAEHSRYIADINGIFHAANAGTTSWANLALMVNDLLGRNVKVKAVEQRDHLRPTNSALLSTRLPAQRNWLVALMEWRDRREARMAVTA